MFTLEDAILLATRAHAGQLDKSGDPYILHPIAVMLEVGKQPFVSAEDRTRAMKAAVLHDVVEDTYVSHELLWSYCGDTKLCEMVHAITHVPNEPTIEYYSRIFESGIDTAFVKIEDMKHNLGRLGFLDDEYTVTRLNDKYTKGINLLKEYVNTYGS